MTQVFVNPDELVRFARNLRQFNGQLREDMHRLNAQFLQLGAAWRDKEHQKFAAEFQQTMVVIREFLLIITDLGEGATY